MDKLCFTLIAALTLSACDRDVSPAPDPAVPPTAAALEAAAASGAPEGAVRPRFVAPYLDGSEPDWLQIMRQSDGAFVQYSPATLFRYPAENTAEVWVQLVHRQTLQEPVRTSGGVETLDFSKERYHYLLDCEGERFTILERQLVAAETPFWTVAMDERADPDWRPIIAGGPAAVLKGPLCDAL